MIKKVKIILVLLILIGIISIPLKVTAHSVELDPKNLITLPFIIFNGKGTITISSSEKNYTLYYQAVEIPDSTYSQIKQISEDGEEEAKKIETELDALDAECDNLKEILNEKYEAYTNASEDQKEQARTEYETAKTNYNEKAKQYNNKANEYKEKVNEVNVKINELTPTYVESNWIKTDNNSIFVDLSKFSGQKTFAMWVKLVSSDGTTCYDETIYTMSGTKANEIKVESINLDKTTLSIKEGSNYTLIATITPNDATNKSIDWSSDNENVAKVENGKITAISEGIATITAKTKDGGFTATCKVTVTKKEATQNQSSTDTNKQTETNEQADTDKEDKEKVNDTTISKGTLPQTGTNVHYIIVSMMIILSVIGFICYKKVKFYNFK